MHSRSAFWLKHHSGVNFLNSFSGELSKARNRGDKVYFSDALETTLNKHNLKGPERRAYKLLAQKYFSDEKRMETVARRSVTEQQRYFSRLLRQEQEDRDLRDMMENYQNRGSDPND
ncbi:hypothetical protein KC865_01590 [Candidatus Kaiserbacteria bacterium]|nr:hypothetical protein [Candidatus Kaiserbacteria bacterium]